MPNEENRWGRTVLGIVAGLAVLPLAAANVAVVSWCFDELERMEAEDRIERIERMLEERGSARTEGGADAGEVKP